jgi:hypothetical protein
MLGKIFSFLNKDLTGNTWNSEASHPYFGEMTYYGFKKNNNGYWECEVEFEGGYLSVIINSPDEVLPTINHEEFVKSILNDMDKTFAKIKSLMYSTFENWKELEITDDWRKVFELSAIEVPLDCNPLNNWDIGFECLLDKDGHYFTCYFENGIPTGVSVDG